MVQKTKDRSRISCKENSNIKKGKSHKPTIATYTISQQHYRIRHTTAIREYGTRIPQ